MKERNNIQEEQFSPLYLFLVKTQLFKVASIIMFSVVVINLVQISGISKTPTNYFPYEISASFFILISEKRKGLNIYILFTHRN